MAAPDRTDLEMSTTPQPAPIEWLQSFEIGHREIDQEHRKILESLNDLMAAGEQDRFADMFELCETFRHRLGAHFTSEEALLRQNEFPRVDAHSETHRRHYDNVYDIVSNCGAKCKRGQDHDCAGRFAHILVDHLIRDDLDFKSFLNHTLGVSS
jgi:hemerythrin-like metal-binding protein